MREVYVLVGGDGATVSVVNPLGGEEDASAVYSSAEQKLWKVEPGYPGVYSVTVS